MKKKGMSAKGGSAFGGNLKKLAYWASVSVIGLVVGISLQMVRANWVVPTGPAPSGNIAAPVNTGGTLVTPPQRKTGSLAVDGAFFDVKNNLYVESGNVGIGTTTPSAKLEIGGTAGTDGIKFPDGTLQTTAYGEFSLFGGMYQRFMCNAINGTYFTNAMLGDKLNTGAAPMPALCRIANKLTGKCSCPDGYVATPINDFNTGDCTTQTEYSQRGMTQYYCYPPAPVGF